MKYKSPRKLTNDEINKVEESDALRASGGSGRIKGNKKMKLIYMGTPDFAVPALESLAAAGHEISYVVTQPDAMRDRGKKVKFSPVKEKALELGIEVLQPERIKKNTEFLEKLEEAKPDAIIVAAYGKILPKAVLELPKYGCLNIHGSLLPRFRGAAPIQAAIIEGDEKTGITIMFMEKGLDTGDMIAKAATPIGKKTGEELHDELSIMGAKLMVETLEAIEAGEFTREKQDDALSTYAPMISKADGHIDFTESPQRIERKIRAFDPWPGSFAVLNGKTFKFFRAEAIACSELYSKSSASRHSESAGDASSSSGAYAASGTSTYGETCEVSDMDASNEVCAVGDANASSEVCASDDMNSSSKELANEPLRNGGSGIASPGTIVAVSKDSIDIAAGGGILRVSEIQAAGKKRMSVRDYLIGSSIEIGAMFE